MLSELWWVLIRRLALLFLGATWIGWVTGQMLLALCLAAFAALAGQLWQLYQLDCWLKERHDAQMPQASLVWRDVFERVSRLRQQSRKRKRKTERLMKLFRRATAALPDAAMVLGEDDCLLWCNKNSQRLLGLNLGRDTGFPITNLLRHPEFITFLGQRRSENVEFPSPLDDSLILNARIVPYGKKQRLLLVSDISHVRRLERVRSDFVANVSHELRTPLTVIVGYLETLLDNENDALEAWRRPLRGMQQQAGRMLHIIEDLLLLARLESQKEQGTLKPVAVPVLLDDIAEDAVALSGEQNHRIEVEADADLWILGCEKELRSAFSNLVFNAVRYTPAGGWIGIHWFSDDQGIHLSVRDNGEGIAAPSIPRLTERFYRVNRDRSRGSGGTGLGLSIVKHVLNYHGGRLQIESELGIGSVFRCEFPNTLRVE